MRTYHSLIILCLFSALSGPVIAKAPEPANLSNPKAHYVRECKAFIAQELYEPALFSCYNAFQLGDTDMGAVLYHLGRNHFYDDITSNNLMQEYKIYKGSPEIRRLLLNIKFASQNDAVVRGSIYGSWCFDHDININENRSFNGYRRLVINPAGNYIQASDTIEKGVFRYKDNVLSLRHPHFSDYQVKILGKNKISLQSEDMKTAQVYSRKSCSKLGMQRFIQVLADNTSKTRCDGIRKYLGRQLIPEQHLPEMISNKLKQDLEGYNCPQGIQKISEA